MGGGGLIQKGSGEEDGGREREGREKSGGHTVSYACSTGILSRHTLPSRCDRKEDRHRH